MIYLKCTGEVQKAVGLRKEQLAEVQAVAAPMGSWYVHRFAIGRKRFFLFMSEVTLLSFVLQQGRKLVTAQTLPATFMAGLGQLLAMKGVGPERIDRVLQDCGSGRFAKTDSRKVLGSMNDLVQNYSFWVQTEGAACDLTHMIMQINDMPQRTLGWRTSWEVSLALLAGTAAVP